MNQIKAAGNPLYRSLQPNLRDIDRHVGMRLRQRRVAVRLTLSKLAARAGIAYQQVHKYETSVNRIAASKLYRIACALEVEVGYFFESMRAVSDINRSNKSQLGKQRLLLDLLHHFKMIQDPHLQEALLSVTRAIHQGHKGSDPTATHS